MLHALLCYLKQGRMTPDSFSEVEKEKKKGTSSVKCPIQYKQHCSCVLSDNVHFMTYMCALVQMAYTLRFYPQR